METKDFAFEVKETSPEGRVIGYGSTFGGSPDSYGDVISPGAFVDSLGEHRRKGTKPKMLWQHDAAMPIGVWNDLAEDGKGLRVEGQLNLDKQIGRDVHSDLKMGALDGLSIGFSTVKAEPDTKRPGVRVLQEVKLWEISIVTFAANPNAGITAVKSLADAEKWARVTEWVKSLADGEDYKPSIIDDILRDAGMSKKQRTRVASRIFAALRSESEEPEAKTAAAVEEARRQEQFLSAIRQLRAAI